MDELTKGVGYAIGAFIIYASLYFVYKAIDSRREDFEGDWKRLNGKELSRLLLLSVATGVIVALVRSAG